MNKAAKDAEWAKAKKLCRLNEIEIRMAKELGMTPKSLTKNIPAPSQQWKAPVKVWVRELYAKKFGNKLPAGSISPPPRPEGHSGRQQGQQSSRQSERSAVRQSGSPIESDNELPF